MNKRATIPALAVTCCVGLAACGGISTRYANGSGPAAYAGPVDVAVIGPANDGIAADSVLAAASTALRDLGLRAGETTVAGDIASMSKRVVVADASASAGVSDTRRARVIMTDLATGSANPKIDSRVIVLHGPIADDLAKSQNRNWADTLCADGAGPLAGGAAAHSAEASGTPTAVVLCSGSSVQSVVSETFDTTGTTGEGVPQALLVNLVERAFTGDVTD
jgi:hypothetical protein